MTKARLVRKVEQMYEGYKDCTCVQCMSPVIVKLLRAERRRVVRLIEQQPRFRSGVESMWYRSDGEWISATDLLAKLKEER